MNFLDAVKTCYKNYAKFKGRASRSEFWFFWSFNYIIYAILTIIALNISLKFFWFLGAFFRTFLAGFDAIMIHQKWALNLEWRRRLTKYMMDLYFTRNKSSPRG